MYFTSFKEVAIYKRALYMARVSLSYTKDPTGILQDPKQNYSAP